MALNKQKAAIQSITGLINQLDTQEKDSWLFNSDGIIRPLLDSYSKMPDPYTEQINLDLKRTFTDDKEFTSRPEYISQMRNILASYAKRNSSVGYCQGMNYLAGMIVRVVENEEDAFWTFWNLFECILPIDYFCLMTEILIDQKVFTSLVQKHKKRLYRHIHKSGLDFALISFQWFVCLLSSNLSKEISETIWDFMFLEGSVAIFRGALAILSILEQTLLKVNQFTELYSVLDTEPLKSITSPDIMIKHMSKFMNVTPKSIAFLREKYRDTIMRDQKEIWQENSRSNAPVETDSSLMKRVKILNKFFMLNKVVRKSKDEYDAEKNFNDQKSIDISTTWCHKWPLWLYEFTVRSRISSYFCFKTANPVEIFDNYFASDLKLEKEEKFDTKYFLVPCINKKITIYDSSDDKKRKRLESLQRWDSDLYEPANNPLAFNEDSLLMSRETHLWVYKGFEKQFSKMFNEEAE